MKVPEFEEGVNQERIIRLDWRSKFGGVDDGDGSSFLLLLFDASSFSSSFVLLSLIDAFLESSLQKEETIVTGFVYKIRLRRAGSVNRIIGIMEFVW